MLTKTTVLAAQALTFMAQRELGTVFSPRGLAEALGQSQPYLAKVLRHLVRAGILRSGRGSKGGVQIDRPPEEVTLLAVVEACQGAIVADCRPAHSGGAVCAFHRAVDDLFTAVTAVLARHDLRELAAATVPNQPMGSGPSCLMTPRPIALRRSPGRAPSPRASRRSTRS